MNKYKITINRKILKKVRFIFLKGVFSFSLLSPLTINQSYFFNFNHFFYTNNLSTKQVQSSSLKESTLSEYEPKNLSDSEIELKLSESLKKINSKFDSIFKKIKTLFPSNLVSSNTGDLIFVLKNITNKNFNNGGFYQTLFSNFFKIIKKSIISENFYYLKDTKNFNKKNLNQVFYPKFDEKFFGVNDEDKVRVKSFISNTLTDEEKIKAIGSFLLKIQNLANIDVDENNFTKLTSYPGWFSNLQENSLPNKEYAAQISSSKYYKLISEISTNKNQTLVESIYKLTDFFSNKIQTPIKQKFDLDKEKLKTINTSENFFVDQTPFKIANILNSSNSDNLSNKLLEKWNFLFSKEENLIINSEILKNNPDLKIQINNVSWSNGPRIRVIDTFKSKNLFFNYKKSFNGSLILNNALINKEISDANTYFGYKKEPDQTANFLLNYLKQKLTTNLKDYITLNQNIEDQILSSLLQRSIPKIDSKDFNLKENLANLKKYIKIAFAFYPQFNSPSNIQSISLGSLPVNVEIKLFVSSLNNEGIFYNSKFQSFYNLEKNDFRKLAKPFEIPPVYVLPTNSDRVSTSQIVSDVNSKNWSKHFTYNNYYNSFLKYSAIKAELLKNSNVKVTSKIENSENSDQNWTYENIFDKSVFLSDTEFEKAAWNRSVEINKNIKLLVGEGAYNNFFFNDLHNKIYNESVNETKSVNNFFKISLEKKIKLFDQIYQKKIKNIFNKFDLNNFLNDDSFQKNAIDKYYDDLNSKIDDFVNKAGLDKNSILVKGWYETINQSRQNVDNRFNNFGLNNDPKLKDLLSILNISNNDNRFNQLAKIVQNVDPKNLKKILTDSQKILISIVTGITGITLIGAMFFFYRILKINGNKFKIKKNLFLSFATTIGVVSIGTLIYLIIILSGAIA